MFQYCTYMLLVPSPVIRGKCTGLHTLSQSYDKIHYPEPAEQMVDLHAEEVTVKADTPKHQLSQLALYIGRV